MRWCSVVQRPTFGDSVGQAQLMKQSIVTARVRQSVVTRCEGLEETEGLQECFAECSCGRAECLTDPCLLTVCRDRALSGHPVILARI